MVLLVIKLLVIRLAQSDGLKVVYLDIFSCRSDKDFYDAFASAILKQTSSKMEEWVENAKLFLARITPKISIGPDPMTDSKTFQKRLRSVWQLQKSVSYCLFGSKKHLMNELFEKKSYPFYKFGDAIYLSKIGTRDWVEYICQRFEVTGKKISEDLAEKIYNLSDEFPAGRYRWHSQ